MSILGFRGPRRVQALVVIGLVYFGWQWMREGQLRVGDLVLWPPEQAQSTGALTGGEENRLGKIERLFSEARSDVIVQASGEVRRLLIDDNQGARHQRFVLELPSGHTVLVAHNIDLAQRVPLGRGDRVQVKGEYEWNEDGGVIHWTHRDPRGAHEGGWIRHFGDIYQ
jgi:hypothetical protein